MIIDYTMGIPLIDELLGYFIGYLIYFLDDLLPSLPYMDHYRIIKAPQFMKRLLPDQQ